MMLIWFLGSCLFFISVGLYYNQTNWGGWYVNWLDGWVRLLCRYWHGQTSEQFNLPEQGAAIVVANHVSGLDPLILVTASNRPLRFLIAREEYQRPVLNWIFRAAGCIPVDRQGRPEKALRQALRALEQGEVLAIFPHGKIHLDSDPPRPIKAGVTRLAEWTQSAVLPVRIDGVGAEGSILLAPFIPSKVSLRFAPKIDVDLHGSANMIEQITAAISPKETSAKE